MSTENKNNFENEVKETTNEFKEGWNQATHGGENKKMIAGILAIIIGAFGIHKFYLGYNKEGLILLLATILTCGFAGMITGIIGLVEGIIYLTKSDEEFYNTYQVGKKTWF